MTSQGGPICFGCTRLREIPTTVDAQYRCEAFPDAIPDAILSNEVDHRDPVDGDHGLRFSPRDSDAAWYAETIFAVESPSLLGRVRSLFRTR